MSVSSDKYPGKQASNEHSKADTRIPKITENWSSHTLSSQARQRAASSAAQKRMAAALSQTSQIIRIITSHFHLTNRLNHS